MIGSFDVAISTMIAFGGCRQWLVFAVLFLPFNLFVASSTDVLNGRRENGGGFLGLWIVMKRKLVLVNGCVAFFLFLDSLILRHVTAVFSKN